MSAKSRIKKFQYILVYCSIVVVGMGSSKIGVLLFHQVMELLTQIMIVGLLMDPKDHRYALSTAIPASIAQGSISVGAT